MGDVQVVRLRASGRGLIAASVLRIFFATLHGVEIVADSDDFCDIFQQAIEGGHDHGSKFNGPLFAGDVRSLQIAHVPIAAGIKPDVKFVVENNLNDFFDHGARQKIFAHDGSQVRLGYDSAIEGRERLIEFERID